MLPQSENTLVRPISREVDIAWLAGIVDGDGCINFEIRKAINDKYYFRPKVRVINTDVRMIQKCAIIYCDMGIVFNYNINKKVKSHYKDQTAIITASQGSCLKVLKAIKPHLANKRVLAEIMIDMIEFVKTFPKGGNTSSHDYINTDRFQELLGKWDQEKKFHIEPSTTSRRAGEIISWW